MIKITVPEKKQSALSFKQRINANEKDCFSSGMDDINLIGVTETDKFVASKKPQKNTIITIFQRYFSQLAVIAKSFVNKILSVGNAQKIRGLCKKNVEKND